MLCLSAVFYTLGHACIVIPNPTRLFAKHPPERCSKVLCLKRNKSQLSKGWRCMIFGWCFKENIRKKAFFCYARYLGAKMNTVQSKWVNKPSGHRRNIRTRCHFTSVAKGRVGVLQVMLLFNCRNNGRFPFQLIILWSPVPTVQGQVDNLLLDSLVQ